MNVLLLDNYDSFTYNLLRILKELNVNVEVHRNDKIAVEEIARFDRILLSPGPGIPEEAGILMQVIKEYAPVKPILGVCLGEQAIGEVFGAKLVNLPCVHHGVSSEIIVGDDPLFYGLNDLIYAGRYHSWAVSKENFPDCLQIIAEDTKNGEIMALRHKEYNVKGIQFHPESVLTPDGKRIIENWIKLL